MSLGNWPRKVTNKNNLTTNKSYKDKHLPASTKQIFPEESIRV